MEIANKYYSSFQALNPTTWNPTTWNPTNYQLEADPESFKWIVRSNGPEILRYVVKGRSNVYSMLEYAVGLQDVESVRILISRGADVDDSPLNKGENMLHWYIHHLEDNTPPNLEILDLLLTHSSDVNRRGGWFHLSPLELAIKHMAGFKTFYGQVIEALFKKGATISTQYPHDPRPFQIFLREDEKSRLDGPRNCEKERIFLQNLALYLEIEKKYCPDSNSSLSVDDFKYHTPNWQYFLRYAASFLNQSSFVLRSSDPLIGDLLDLESIRSAEKDILKIEQVLLEYHRYFQALVRMGNFKACFRVEDAKVFMSCAEVLALLQ
jgi:hypothetical protein